jgi:hypothetical protein
MIMTSKSIVLIICYIEHEKREHKNPNDLMGSIQLIILLYK